MDLSEDAKAKRGLSAADLVGCAGCGALVPDINGPTHRYLGAVAGCWAAYTKILAKEFSEFGYPECHRLTVDTYAVQHPGTPSPQTIQSVGGHLVSMYLVLERGLDAKTATRARQSCGSKRRIRVAGTTGVARLADRPRRARRP